MDEAIRKIALIDERLAAIEINKRELAAEASDLERERARLVQSATHEMLENGCTATEVDGVMWSVRNTPQSVVITDESLIPPKFFREKVTKSVNKTALKSALNAGATVQGAHLSNGGVTLVAKGLA